MSCLVYNRVFGMVFSQRNMVFEGRMQIVTLYRSGLEIGILLFPLQTKHTVIHIPVHHNTTNI